MTAETSIGPEGTKPTDAGDGVKTQATVEGVDAQNANEFDKRHGLTGAGEEPLGARPKPTEASSRNTSEDDDHVASSSQPADDPNQADPNERSDMIAERRNPALNESGREP